MNRSALAWTLTTLFLSLFLFYFVGHAGEFRPVLEIPALTLLIIAALKSVVVYSNGLFMRLTLARFDYTVGHRESFYISLLSAVGNYFAPARAGAGIRAIYLKKKFEFPYTSFLSTLSGYYVIVFLMYSVAGLLSLVLIQLGSSSYSVTLYAFFGSLFAVSLLLAAREVPFRSLLDRRFENRALERIAELARRIIEGWHLILRDRRLLGKLVCVSAANFSVSFLASYIEFKALGIDISLVSLLFYSSLSGVALLVSLTPGSIGIREAIFMFSADLLALTNSEILQVAVVDRSITFFMLLLMFLASRFWQPDEGRRASDGE